MQSFDVTIKIWQQFFIEILKDKTVLADNV